MLSQTPQKEGVACENLHTFVSFKGKKKKLLNKKP